MVCREEGDKASSNRSVQSHVYWFNIEPVRAAIARAGDELPASLRSTTTGVSIAEVERCVPPFQSDGDLKEEKQR